jgi:hypothetical protein
VDEIRVQTIDMKTGRDGRVVANSDSDSDSSDDDDWETEGRKRVSQFRLLDCSKNTTTGVTLPERHNSDTSLSTRPLYGIYPS